ncbi:MAG: hypothetical protein ACRDTR_09090 [Rubrobacter sp.]
MKGSRQQGYKRTGRFYRIVVRGELSERFAVAFEEMRMEAGGGQTVLEGELVDQTYLHGVLDRIGGLGLELVSVESMPAEVREVNGVESPVDLESGGPESPEVSRE